MELVGLQTQGEQVAATRSQLYQLLGSAFAFPDEELHAAIREGELARALATLCGRLPHHLGGDLFAGIETLQEPFSELESEYIRLFDVGPSGPPCPLYGGVYYGDRMKIMEDATRFFNFFGLRLSQEIRELPDHVTTELEFMHYLTFREAEVRQRGENPGSLLRAERDFLDRHLCRWLPMLRQRLAKQETLAFFPALVRFAHTFVAADRDHAAAEAAASDG